MNQFVLDDAISCLDADLLATHLKLKEKYQKRKTNHSRRIVKSKRSSDKGYIPSLSARYETWRAQCLWNAPSDRA